MQYSNSFIGSLVAGLALSPLVSGTIFLGVRTASDGSQSQVAWTNGANDDCDDFQTVVNSNSDPCGIPFSFDGFQTGGSGTYEFEGCGGNGLSVENNGEFNSNCAYEPDTIGCPGGVSIAQAWSCS